MAITVSNSEIIKSARKIRTNPSVVSVRALKFNKKRDYTTFNKWIEASSKRLEKIKLPKKKDIQGISVKGGGIGLLGLLALGGITILGASALKKILDKTEWDLPESPGLGKLKTAVIGGGALGAGTTIVRKGNWFKKLFGGSKSQLKKSSKVTFGKGTQEIIKNSKGFWKKGIRGGILSTGIDIAMGEDVDKAVAGGGGWWAGSALAAKMASPLLVAPFPGARPLYGLLTLAGGFMGESKVKSTYSGIKGWFSKSKDKTKDKTLDTPKVDSELSFSNTLDMFGNVVDDFCKGCSLINSEVDQLNGYTPKVNKDKKPEGGNPFKRFWNWFVPPPDKSNDPLVSEGKSYGFDGTKVRTSKTEVNSAIGMSANQVIVMVPEGTQEPRGGIIPIPIPVGGGNMPSIVVNTSLNKSDFMNSLLLTKLSV